MRQHSLLSLFGLAYLMSEPTIASINPNYLSYYLINSTHHMPSSSYIALHPSIKTPTIISYWNMIKQFFFTQDPTEVFTFFFEHLDLVFILFIILIAVLNGTTSVLLYQISLMQTPSVQTLKKALTNGEIYAWSQPLVCNTSGKISGFEVLARWRHPHLGFISPDIFIPLAEKNGLIDKLTHYVMTQVLEKIRPEISNLPDGLHISFNISANHKNFNQLKMDCRNILSAFGSKPLMLILEITEREALLMTKDFSEMLSFINNNSVVLALDDFGTGYSGLSSLAQLPISIIKLDKFFVENISANPESSYLLDCIIDMANKLSLQIVIEGIENQHQAEYFHTRNVSFLQGYFFGPPVPFTEFLHQIKES